MQMMLASVILCTRNRAAKLRQTLLALLALDVPPSIKLEFIVVDNGSTDETADVCAEMGKTFGGRLERIYAPEPGLGHARNVGLARAQGEIIIFTDDDVIPRSDWLTVIFREFGRDPELGLISGQVQLYNPTDLPISIRTSTERARYLSLGDSFGLLAGCNFAFRRRVLHKVQGFDFNFGAGTPFPVEDADFFYRTWRSGAKLIYEPSMFVWHDHGRRSEQERRGIMRGYVIGRGAFYAKHLLAGDMLAVRAFYWELNSHLKALVSRTSTYSWRTLGWYLRGFLVYLISAGKRSARPYEVSS